MTKKRTRWLAGILLALVLMLITPLQPVQAVDDAYYYESFVVTARVNDKREYAITEVLDVNYREERHGIKRTIPTWSSVESYTVTDVHVDGAPYEVNTYGSEIEIRIGDPDRTVIGHQQYTITYTLKHYQDYDQSHDYLYLNLLGSEFDTEIRHYEATLILEDGLEPLQHTLTSGISSTRNDLQIEMNQEGNVYHYRAPYTIDPYNAVTVQMQLKEGAFANAPEYHFPYIINKQEIDITATEDKDFLVHARYEITNQEATEVDVLFDPEFENYGSDLQVRDFQSQQGNVSMTSIYVHMKVPAGQAKAVFEFTYTLHAPTVYDDDPLRLEMIRSYDDTRTDEFHYRFTFPSDDFTYSITAGRYGDADPSTYQAEKSGNTLTISNNKPFYSGSSFDLDIEYDKEMFHRPLSMLYYIGGGLSMLAAGIFFLVRRLKFGKQIIVDTVEFYPPYDINSIEAGYLIDDTVQTKDVTSLIFYWASKGYLQITDVGDKEYYFEKLMDINPDASAYERTLFNAFFAYGNGHGVYTSDLEDVFYISAQKATRAVKKKYQRGPHQIWKSGSTAIQVIASILALLPFLGCSLLAMYLGSGDLFNSVMTTIATFIPMFVMTAILMPMIHTAPNKVIQVIMGATASIPIGISLILCFIFIPRPLLPLALVGFGCSVIMLLCVKGFRRRTAYGVEIFGKLRGFKEFIKTAEKDRLELLLAEDPNYFYTILPFAQVLHVTKIWENKFKDIMLEPPTWYVSDHPFVYSVFMSDMHRIQSTASKAATPPSSGGSDSGGGFSGGGGSFSGGGSSGGGSGGGGSSSW